MGRVCATSKVLNTAFHPKQNRVALVISCAGVKILARRIRRELRSRIARGGYCAIYEYQLQRLWPINEVNRKAKIAQFAKENGFQLVFYKPGLCAIFEADQPKE